MLVVIGATNHGDKELLAVVDGYHESEQSWLELFNDLKRRGMTNAPKIAVGDGALGFWKALPQVFGETRFQRCWMHKTGNVLDKLPKFTVVGIGACLCSKGATWSGLMCISQILISR